MFKLIEKVMLGLLGVAAVVYIWYEYPEVINFLMDKNLAVIKFVGASLPAPNGARFESAVRFLAGEKTLIFFEASTVLLIIKQFYMSLVRIARKQKH